MRPADRKRPQPRAWIGRPARSARALLRYCKRQWSSKRLLTLSSSQRRLIPRAPTQLDAVIRTPPRTALLWTISDRAMLSAAMRSGAVASRQKEQRRRATTRARRLLLPDTTSHGTTLVIPVRKRKRVSARALPRSHSAIAQPALPISRREEARSLAVIASSPTRLPRPTRANVKSDRAAGPGAGVVVAAIGTGALAWPSPSGLPRR